MIRLCFILNVRFLSSGNFLENRFHQIELQNLPLNLSDVILTRKKDEGFGFVIISSVTKAGSVVGMVAATQNTAFIQNTKV